MLHIALHGYLCSFSNHGVCGSQGCTQSGHDWVANVQDHFIHLTEDPGLLLTVANNFFMADEGDWLCLEIDPAKLTAEVLWPHPEALLLHALLIVPVFHCVCAPNCD